MAHSYQSALNAVTERIFGATATIQYVYLHFFLQVAQSTELAAPALAVCHHYRAQLARRPTSCIDLQLAEIAQSADLRAWYLAVLATLAGHLTALGEAVDHQYLNARPDLQPNHTRPIPTRKLLNLLNDIQWLLAVPDTQPSDDFIWFEDALPNRDGANLQQP